MTGQALINTAWSLREEVAACLAAAATEPAIDLATGNPADPVAWITWRDQVARPAAAGFGAAQAAFAYELAAERNIEPPADPDAMAALLEEILGETFADTLQTPPGLTVIPAPDEESRP